MGKEKKIEVAENAQCSNPSPILVAALGFLPQKFQLKIKIFWNDHFSKKISTEMLRVICV